MSAHATEATNLEPAANGWQHALDADQRALSAVAGIVRADELSRRRSALGVERRETARLLARLATTLGISPPWLVDHPLELRELGLGLHIRACVFDLDGVLTDSGRLHASAWALTFDPFLQETAARAGWQFIPFDRDDDYRSYVGGRPRLDGIHSFLASRGISPDTGTMQQLARRKSDVLARELHGHGVTALDGARRYLEAAGRIGLGRAVVSASARTGSMLELADLDRLVEVQIDAEAMRTERLRPRPAPDLLLAACERLGVPPGAAATFTHNPAGVAAGHVGGLTVIAADSLAALLDRRILAAR
jgi:beta-phosphoglucomutase-like phosphatase (HAD superfamily)